MFEHIRAHLQSDVQSAQTVLNAAQQAVATATANLNSANAAVTNAQNAVNAAANTLNSAQGSLNAATADQQAKAAALANAQQAVTAWQDLEPDPTGLRGRPNPAWVIWSRRGIPLQAALATAQTAATAANNAVATAQATWNQVAGGLNAAQQGLAAARGQVGTAQQQLTTAQNAQATAQVTVQQAAAQLAAHDARAARFVALPLDPPTLLSLAEEELATAQQLRHTRQQLLTTRKGLHDRHDALIVAHDTTMDAAGVLATDMSTWTDPAYPEPGTAATALKVLSTTSQSARATPPSQRTDDLAATAATVGSALASLQAALARATGVRDAAATRLQNAVNAVTAAANDAP